MRGVACASTALFLLIAPPQNRCSDLVPALRLQRLATLEELEDMADVLVGAKDEAGGRASKLAEAQADLEHALKSESETVESGAFGARATSVHRERAVVCWGFAIFFAHRSFGVLRVIDLVLVLCSLSHVAFCSSTFSCCVLLISFCLQNK